MKGWRSSEVPKVPPCTACWSWPGLGGGGGGWGVVCVRARVGGCGGGCRVLGVGAWPQLSAHLSPAAAAPAPVRSPCGLGSRGLWQGLGPGRTEAGVPMCQTPPCSGSGLALCSVLAVPEVEEAEAQGPRLCWPWLVGSVGSGGRRFGLGVEALVLYSLLSRGFADLPL